VLDWLLQSGLGGSFDQPTEPRSGEQALQPLHIAAAQGDIEALDLLASAGADLDSRSSGPTQTGYTALHFTCARGASGLAVARWLLANGADVGVWADDGQTALHVAAHAGHVPLLQLLIEHGADLFTLRGSDGGSVVGCEDYDTVVRPACWHFAR
jgi:ankyrin repeat protein